VQGIDKSAVARAIDVAQLSPAAQKLLDPAGPAPMRQLAARAIAPGIRPPDAVTVCALLTESDDPNLAKLAQQTMAKLPAPILNGALVPTLQAGVLALLAPLYAQDIAVAEKILQLPQITGDSVIEMAAAASEPVCELIATNEERLLANPAIIEKLYLNKSTRMSTADRLIELAVRNGIRVEGIPAFDQIAKALMNELIPEPTEEPNFDDVQFNEAGRIAAETELSEEGDVCRLDESTGEEVAIDAARPLFAVWADLKVSAKIRLLQVGVESLKRTGEMQKDSKADNSAIRMLGIRDANPLVAQSAAKSPGLQENEVIRITAMRNMSEDVLRIIASDKDWTKSYQIKLNLIANPRTPFAFASRLIPHLRETDLKNLSRSRDISGAVAQAVRQHLSRKSAGK
jgi:hypothetical protein